MKFSFDKLVGKTLVHFEEEAPNQKEMMKKMAFFDALPTEGVKGGKNLRVSYRNPKNNEYMSIVDGDTKMELTMGIYNDDEKGNLFIKKWQPLFGTENGNTEEEAELAAEMAAQEEKKPVEVAKPVTKPALPRPAFAKTAPAPVVETKKVETPAPVNTPKAAEPTNDGLTPSQRILARYKGAQTNAGK